MSFEVSHLEYSYDIGTAEPVSALQDISFRIEDGEFVGIMGQTGCGKTTLIQLLAGLLEPVSGRVLLDGEDINGTAYDRRRLREQVGVVFQYPEHQLFESSVAQDVAFALRHSGLSSGEKKARVQEALALVGMDYADIKDESPMAMSGGEKRRVAIAGVLVLKPRVLIFDEPIAGLDPAARETFLELLTRLNADGVTIIMVSHHADSMGNYARRLLVLDQGRLHLDGTTRDVFRQKAELERLHLDVSDAADVAAALTRHGFDLPEDIVRCDELLDALHAGLAGGAR